MPNSEHTDVRDWLEQNPRFVVHFTPTHASWMNLGEGWFGIVKRQAIRRGVFKSVKDLNTKVRDFVDAWNDRSHPFVWTKTTEEMILKKAVQQLQLRATSRDAGSRGGGRWSRVDASISSD